MKTLELAIKARTFFAHAVVAEAVHKAKGLAVDVTSKAEVASLMKSAGQYAFRCGWETAVCGREAIVPLLLKGDSRLASAFYTGFMECGNEDHVVAWKAPANETLNKHYMVYVTRRLSGNYEVIWQHCSGNKDAGSTDYLNLDDAISAAQAEIAQYGACVTEEMGEAAHELARIELAYELAV